MYVVRCSTGLIDDWVSVVYYTHPAHKCKELPNNIEIQYTSLYQQWFIIDHNKRLITKGIKYCVYCGKKL